MIFSIVLILLVLVVAFFHYLQGFFSATISAILVAVSVLLAFSYCERVIDMIKPGKLADSGYGMILLALFAIIYLILRIIFDSLVKGNVRVPATLDKVGAGVMGLLAGILAVGTVAVAAQMLPFGPSIAGYSRYRILDPQQVGVKISDNQSADRMVYDELASYSIGTTPEGKEVPHESLVGLPLDDMVLGFVYHTSDGGSTAGAQPLARIHPDWLQELFGNRIGIELGAKRSAQPVGGTDSVNLVGVYTIPSIPQADAEPPSVRKRSDEDKLPKTLAPDPSHVLLVVRLQFRLDATDTDKLTRVSCGSVRLVAPAVGDDGRQTYRNYFPVGTVEGGRQLMVSKPDDFLFVPADKAADFLFVVDASALPDMKTQPLQIPADSEMFVEAKRYGRNSLAGKAIEPLAPSEQVQVLRKKLVIDSLANSNPEVLQKRLYGSWNGDEGGTPVLYTFTNDGKWTGDLTVGGNAMKVGGTWKAVSANAGGLTIDFTTAKGAPKKFLIAFTNNDSATMTDLTSKKVTTLTRKQ